MLKYVDEYQSDSDSGNSEEEDPPYISISAEDLEKLSETAFIFIDTHELKIRNRLKNRLKKTRFGHAVDMSKSAAKLPNFFDVCLNKKKDKEKEEQDTRVEQNLHAQQTVDEVSEKDDIRFLKFIYSCRTLAIISYQLM